LKRLVTIFLFVALLSGCGGGNDSVTSVDGVSIAFQKMGEGETTLVLVHGWSCDQTYWRNQTAFLAEKFTVVTLDLAGHGQSALGRTNYTIDAFAADVAAVVTALDLHNVYLIGHSMGGPVVVEAAGLLSDRVVGVIGIDTLQEVGWELTEAQVDGFMTPMAADFPATAIQLVKSMFPAGADTALVGQISKDMSGAPEEVALSAMRNLLLHDLKPTLSQLKAPIWCLNANMNPVDFQGWKFYEPGYTAVLMEGLDISFLWSSRKNLMMSWLV